jgi:hypothetical protein
VVKTGKAPVLEGAEWRKLLDSIPTVTVRDLRDRALILDRHAHLFLRTHHRGTQDEGGGFSVARRRLDGATARKGGKEHAMPCHHALAHDPQAIENLLVDLFVEAHARPPRQIILDLDATDDPLHGHQEGRFFHGYYDCYCYLPLYVFCGRHLVAAKLRRSNIDASAGAVEEVTRIVAHIRTRWARVRILLRADAGFAREELMCWCEHNGVDFLFGLAKNARLTAAIAAELAAARQLSEQTGKPARRFKDFAWSTLDSWSGSRRVIGKAEWTGGEANPRFVVTSLARSEHEARHLYEKVYCARGDMENRIKECQLDLFADRTSATTMRANQLRLWFAAMAYVLVCALRRIALRHTHFAEATCGTIRLRLFKIGALVRVSVRRIKVAIASACPYQNEFALAHLRLTAAAH